MITYIQLLAPISAEVMQQMLLMLWEKSKSSSITVKMTLLWTVLEFFSTLTVSTGKESDNGREHQKKSGPDMEKSLGGQKFLETYGLLWLMELDIWYQVIDLKLLTAWLVISSTTKMTGINDCSINNNEIILFSEALSSRRCPFWDHRSHSFGVHFLCFW